MPPFHILLLLLHLLADFLKSQLQSRYTQPISANFNWPRLFFPSFSSFPFFSSSSSSSSSSLNLYRRYPIECCSVLQCVAVCCSVLQCVAVCCSLLQCVAVCCSVLRCVAVCCSVLQCVAVRCSVLQCVAVCCSDMCVLIYFGAIAASVSRFEKSSDTFNTPPPTKIYLRTP